jgi:hypothetical protein
VPTFRSAVVASLLAERAGLQRVEVDVDADGDGGAGEAVRARAYVLTDLVGPVAPGDRVILNTTAVELGLGTGGWHVVHWNLARAAWSQPGPGHIMKLRYTSLQADTGAAEELHEGVLAGTHDLGGAPVVVCGLHSQVACVAAAFHRAAPDARLAYVMTDGAALPLALSDLVHDLRAAALLVGTVTVGHAFGGDHEAVTPASGLLVARALLGADAVVVGMGPGVVGTGTALGYSAFEVGGLLDAAQHLGGRPVAAIRYSDADPRPRHQGVSHHVITALARGTSSTVRLALPVGGVGERVRRDLEASGLADRHRLVDVEVPDMAGVLAGLGLRVTTMGRGPTDDPGFFAAAGAAGVLAASLATGGRAGAPDRSR